LAVARTDLSYKLAGALFLTNAPKPEVIVGTLPEIIPGYNMKFRINSAFNHLIKELDESYQKAGRPLPAQRYPVDKSWPQ
jgi:hypothetical protein